jgi:RNA polymerase sigma-70 factor (ECF subfamily)
MRELAHPNVSPHAPLVSEPHASTHAGQMLIAWNQDAEGTREEMLPLVYDELRRLARGYLTRERDSHTLQATALVHEAYLRLIDQRKVDWKNRAQLVGVAAVMMRRVLVNHAREHAAGKRGGDAERVTLSVAGEAGMAPAADVLDLHHALARLEALDPRKGRIVELKFFGGLTTTEIAQVLELSSATIEREWSFAKAWLYDAIGGAPA